jgi:arginyl-tRNA synthetase
VIPKKIAEIIENALLRLVKSGDFSLDIEELPAEITVEKPKSKEFGDWSSNIAMQLAKKAGMSPRALAERLAHEIAMVDDVEKAEVAGPGFINIFVSNDARASVLCDVIYKNADFGRNLVRQNDIINLEFVSANPTGPLHLAGARWAAVGDSLTRILEFSGAKVVREYYINDHGVQIDNFAASLKAVAEGTEIPENGYHGEYVGEIAAKIITSISKKREPAAIDIEEYADEGVKIMLDEIKRDLIEFRVKFDVFFKESSLYTDGKVAKAIEKLQNLGALYKKDGALWFQSTDFGDDKDRVLTKSNGENAYFAADIAYYIDKLERGANSLIYILGADHHGYVGRLAALSRALGFNPDENLRILIGQTVSLLRDGKVVKQSKRAGDVLTLQDLIGFVGADAARYSLARSSVNSTLDIDLNLLMSNTNENQVYYVQYAHARTQNIERKATKYEGYLDYKSQTDDFKLDLLDTDLDKSLITTIAEFESIAKTAAKELRQHLIAHYIERLAQEYHKWYATYRALPSEGEKLDDKHLARLYLNKCVGIVIKNGLNLLGVEAPDRM